jgi:hypothetical protein
MKCCHGTPTYQYIQVHTRMDEIVCSCLGVGDSRCDDRLQVHSESGAQAVQGLCQELYSAPSFNVGEASRKGSRSPSPSFGTSASSLKSVQRAEQRFKDTNLEAGCRRECQCHAVLYVHDSDNLIGNFLLYFETVCRKFNLT